MKAYIQATIANYTRGGNNTNVGVVTVSGAAVRGKILTNFCTSPFPDSAAILENQ